MRIVIDTNVLISAFLSSYGSPAEVFREYEHGSFDLLVSEPILVEYQQALTYPKVQMRHQLSDTDVAHTIEEVRRGSIVVTPKSTVALNISDKDDIKFFACAVAGEGEYIVSGDRLVQDVGAYKGIQVLSPSLFLTVLEKAL
mgnify:CR=1 FL=1